MRKAIHRIGLAAIAALSVLLSASVAHAQIETTISPIGESNRWSATAGRTVGTGNSVLQAEAGWPGIGFTWLKGINELSDYGLHVGFNYGFEGTSKTVTGFNLAVPYRRTLATSGDTSFAFETQPGLSIYSNNGAMVGVGGPIGVVGALQVTPQLTLDLAAEVPVLITFTNPTGVVFGPQFGGGGEYLIDRNLAVTARLRIGPRFALDSAGSDTQTGFVTLIGLAYNAH
jgi:opacity protein-like surface antigen